MSQGYTLHETNSVAIQVIFLDPISAVVKSLKAKANQRIAVQRQVINHDVGQPIVIVVCGGLSRPETIVKSKYLNERKA